MRPWGIVELTPIAREVPGTAPRGAGALWNVAATWFHLDPATAAS